VFGGDDHPIAFGDRSDIQAARAQSDPAALVRAFARIGRDFMERSSAIMHVLATTAAQYEQWLIRSLSMLLRRETPVEGDAGR
jgi:hypothetical protein